MRRVLNTSAFPNDLTIRFYDHITPTYLDIIHPFSKSGYLSVNLDDEADVSHTISSITTRSIFSLTQKTYGVGTVFQNNSFFIITQDAHAKIYCGQ